MSPPTRRKKLGRGKDRSYKGRPSAGVAKLVDATDLKSVGPIGLCGFDSRRPHH
jgi:hypothetical protein